MSTRPILSVVIPTFNRRDIVARSIDSARVWAGSSDIEIIVVDDGSSDDTLSYLRSRYDCGPGGIKLISTPKNLGAAGAKNHGAAAATGDWVLFLDSDDALVADGREPVFDAMRKHRNHPVLFFRCIEMSSGTLVGAPISQPKTVSVREYLRGWRWGECLPVVRRDAFLRFPYEARLRGHEGLAYARLLKHVGPGMICPAVVRAYDTGGSDRLSRRPALWRRGSLIAVGFALTLREFSRELGPSRFVATVGRLCFYATAGQVMRGIDVVSKIGRNR